MADQLRPGVPKLSAEVDEAGADVLARKASSKDPRTKLHPINAIERVNGEIKRRTDVSGRELRSQLPNDDAIVRLVGASPLEQNGERSAQRSRSPTPETIAAMSDDPLVGLPPKAA